MESFFSFTSLLAVTVVSIQMGLFFNWALLSLMLKAMNRIRPTAKNPQPSDSH